jgi:hypothetical protein
MALSSADPEAVTTILLYGGRPIGESIAFGGPLVMNSEDEIRTACDDYRRGAFGDIPRQAWLNRR